MSDRLREAANALGYGWYDHTSPAVDNATVALLRAIADDPLPTAQTRAAADALADAILGNKA